MEPESRKDKFKHRVPVTSHTTYPYHFDHDVIQTEKSIKAAEKRIGKKFTDKGARKAGLDILEGMRNPLGERSDPIGESPRDIRNKEGKLLHKKHHKLIVDHYNIKWNSNQWVSLEYSYQCII